MNGILCKLKLVMESGAYVPAFLNQYHGNTMPPMRKEANHGYYSSTFAWPLQSDLKAPTLS
jgi:hypothetical protein